MRRKFLLLFSLFAVTLLPNASRANEVDRVLTEENGAQQVTSPAMPVVEDMAFLRRVYVDLIGRIPTGREVHEFSTWPAEGRREKLIDKLLADERFADRWTTFFADTLRLRSNATGGSALIAYVHNAIAEDMPYDELCRRLIATNGKANYTPEAGFILGDDADPLQMAAVTSQVFLGVRMSCAQCHDHPFDVWTRKDFYGLAAYFGRTRRIESRFTKVVYTTEADQTTILWPPQDAAEEGESRAPMKPTFPIELLDQKQPFDFVARLEKLRTEQEAKRRAAEVASAETTVDDLLDLTAEKAKKQTSGSPLDQLGVNSEAKRDIRKIDVKASLYRHSQLRSQLADLVTNPRNRYFSRAIVNRLWKELIGRGFVEPVDDFRADNEPSHPRTLDYLADEFVAGGFQFRELVRNIVTSDAYQREHAPNDADYATREELEASFLATPMRRMMAESLYDSVVAAGHLFELKHPAGANEKVVVETVRVPKVVKGPEGKGPEAKAAQVLTAGQNAGNNPAMVAQAGRRMGAPAGYALEDAIELDFDKLLTAKEEEVKLDKMMVMSAEELEAQRMLMQTGPARPGMEYVTKTVERVYDDNPRFNSSLRMASPAPAGHFLRVFGQPGRDELGDLRDDGTSMRQALMMLNGRLTHEASRVAREPVYALLKGPQPNVEKAIKMAYVEILTRLPTADEVAEARQIVGEEPLAGIADLRWVLLNCNEFRFLP